MRKIILTLIAVMACAFSFAQHIDFCGVEIQGDIRDFSEPMRQAGFKLKKKVVDDHYYIYEGTFCNQSSYLKADYTPKSRTVYQIKVTPSHIDANAYFNELKKVFGEPIETQRGYKWEKENGSIFFFTPEGLDPFLYIIDNKGFETLKKERS